MAKSCFYANPCMHTCRTLIGYFVSPTFGTMELGGCIF